MIYLSSASQKALSARYRLTVLIVAALGISTVLYVVIGWAFAPAMPRGEYEWLTNSHYIIVVLVSSAAVAIVFLRRLFLSATRLLRVGQRGVNALLGHLHLSSLIGAVLGDGIGILGVVASLVTGNREYSWRLGLAALLMIAYSFPRRNEWERAVALSEQEKNNTTEPKSATIADQEVKLGLLDTE
jgi:F0F1-type ATP synthase membrane subunit c/vacuolar-type H+-ATPase subunit K